MESPEIIFELFLLRVFLKIRSKRAAGLSEKEGKQYARNFWFWLNQAAREFYIRRALIWNNENETDLSGFGYFREHLIYNTYRSNLSPIFTNRLFKGLTPGRVEQLSEIAGRSYTQRAAQLDSMVRLAVWFLYSSDSPTNNGDPEASSVNHDYFDLSSENEDENLDAPQDHVQIEVENAIAEAENAIADISEILASDSDPGTSNDSAQDQSSATEIIPETPTESLSETEDVQDSEIWARDSNPDTSNIPSSGQSSVIEIIPETPIESEVEDQGTIPSSGQSSVIEIPETSIESEAEDQGTQPSAVEGSYENILLTDSENI